MGAHHGKLAVARRAASSPLPAAPVLYRPPMRKRDAFGKTPSR